MPVATHPVAPHVENRLDRIAAVRDGGVVFLDGQRIADVTAHLACRDAVGSAAALYECQAQPNTVGRMTFDIGGGVVQTVLDCYLTPVLG